MGLAVVRDEREQRIIRDRTLIYCLDTNCLSNFSTLSISLTEWVLRVCGKDPWLEVSTGININHATRDYFRR